MFPQIAEKEQQELIQLATKIRLQTEIDNINLQLEALSVREELESTNLSSEKEALQQRKHIFEEEMAEIKSADISFLNLRKELETYKTRLEKLEEKKHSSDLSDKVYKTIYNEYSEKISSIQAQFTAEEKRLKEFLAQCTIFLNKIDETKEETKIRGELGEFDTGLLATKLKELEIQEKRAADLKKAIEQLLK